MQIYACYASMLADFLGRQRDSAAIYTDGQLRAIIGESEVIPEASCQALGPEAGGMEIGCGADGTAGLIKIDCGINLIDGASHVGPVKPGIAEVEMELAAGRPFQADSDLANDAEFLLSTAANVRAFG